MYTSNPDLSHLPSVALTDLKEITPEFYLCNIKMQIYHSAADLVNYIPQDGPILSKRTED